MHDTWSVSEPGVIDLPDVAACAVSIILAGGSLAILAGDGPGAQVEVSGVSGPALGVTFDGSTLRVEHHRDAGGDLLSGVRRALSGMVWPSARVTVRVPGSGAVAVKAATASVYAEGLRGRLRVMSGSGAVSVDRQGGDLDVKSGVGGVTVRRSTPQRAAFASLSGAIDVELASSRCLLTAGGGGSLSVRAPGGGLDLTATTRGTVSVDGRVLLPHGVQDALPDDEAAPEQPSGVPTLHHADGDRSLVIKAKLRGGSVEVSRDDTGPQDRLDSGPARA